MSLHSSHRIGWLWPALLALLLLALPGETWAAGTPAGTVIRNTAIANYKDVNGSPLPQIQSNEVTTVVAQVAGPDVSPATGAENLLAGGDAVYHLHVTNIGNGPDVLDLSVSGLPAGWPSVIYQDLDNDGILDPEEQVAGNVLSSTSLAADAVVAIFLVVTSPAGVADATVGTATLTATSQYDTGVSDTGTYTSTVSIAVLTMSKFVTPEDPQPGDVVTYEIRGVNGGSAIAYNVAVSDLIPSGMTYVTGSMRYATGAGATYGAAGPLTDAVDTDPADFGVTAANTVTVKWGDSPAGQQGSVFFKASVNEGLAATTAISNIAVVTYENPEGTPRPAINSSPATTTIAADPGPTFTLASVSGTGEPADSLFYAINVTNGGNATDVIDITTSSTGGFPNEVWVDANGDGIAGNDGDYLLADTDGDGFVDTGSLRPDQSLNLLVVVIIPPGTGDGEVDVTTVTATSSMDPTVSTSGTVTTTVYAPNLSMTKSVSPTGSQPPGQVLTYTVVVTNNGQGVATDVIVTDPIPTNTTYVANSVTVGGVARTDATDGDNVLVQNNEVVVSIGTLGPGGTRTIAFSATIN